MEYLLEGAGKKYADGALAVNQYNVVGSYGLKENVVGPSCRSTCKMGLGCYCGASS